MRHAVFRIFASKAKRRLRPQTEEDGRLSQKLEQQARPSQTSSLSGRSHDSRRSHPIGLGADGVEGEPPLLGPFATWVTAPFVGSG